jgi:enoyl-CoA hydratase/carnithine racemase
MFSQYKDKFRNVKLEMADGILEMRLHTNDGPLLWGFRDRASIHGQLGDVFYEIAHDPDVKVLIITGTGDEFLVGSDRADGHPVIDVPIWDRLIQEGRDMIMNYLDIGAVVISAVNGPATYHSEIPTMADIVIASDTAVFADPHMQSGAVPGDGVHVWWPMLLGPNRGRSFLLTGEPISAEEGKRLGFVTEVVPQERTLPRAREIAAELATKPPLALKYARAALTQEIKRRMLNDFQLGFALESLASLGRSNGSD